MGKLTLLAVGLGAVVLMQSRHFDHGGSARAEAGVALGETYEVLARSCALAGVARVEQSLIDAFADVSVTGAFGEGTYTASGEVIDTDRARITAVGSFPRPDGSLETFRIRTLVGFGRNGVPVVLPPFLEYAALADGDLLFSGSADVVFPSASTSQFSPRIHANEDMIISGNTRDRVRGFGSYTGTISGVAGNTFRPPYNPDNLPRHQQADEVDIPDLDPEAITRYYSTVVDHYPLRSGDPAFSDRGGTIPGGPRTAPIVYHVHGDLVLNGSHIDGYALFVVEGDAHISKVVTASGSGAPGVESTLAVYTTGSVNLGGSSSIQAQLFAEGGLSYTGSVDVYGSIVTGGTLDLGGAMQIHGVPASPALSGPWGEGGRGLAVLAYAEQ